MKQQKLFNKLQEDYAISAREYFEVLKLALYHVSGVVAKTSTEVVQADMTDEVWECACDILNALHKQVKVKVGK